jgi:hypothetical protein
MGLLPRRWMARQATPPEGIFFTIIRIRARSRAFFFLTRAIEFDRSGWPDMLNSQVVRQFSDSPPEIDNQRGEKKQQTYNGQDNDNEILHFILCLSATSRVGAIQLF